MQTYQFHRPQNATQENRKLIELHCTNAIIIIINSMIGKMMIEQPALQEAKKKIK